MNYGAMIQIITMKKEAQDHVKYGSHLSAF